MIGAAPMERRYRLLQFEPEMLARIVGQGSPVMVMDEEVTDLRIVAVREHDWRGVLEFLAYSETFEVVSDGMEPPCWKPAFTYPAEAVP